MGQVSRVRRARDLLRSHLSWVQSCDLTARPLPVARQEHGLNTSVALQALVSIAQKLKKKRVLAKISLATAPEFFLQEGSRAVSPLAKESQRGFAQPDDRAETLGALTTLFNPDSELPEVTDTDSSL